MEVPGVAEGGRGWPRRGWPPDAGPVGQVMAALGKALDGLYGRAEAAERAAEQLADAMIIARAVLQGEVPEHGDSPMRDDHRVRGEWAPCDEPSGVRTGYELELSRDACECAEPRQPLKGDV